MGEGVEACEGLDVVTAAVGNFFVVEVGAEMGEIEIGCAGVGVDEDVGAVGESRECAEGEILEVVQAGADYVEHGVVGNNG